MKLSKSIDHTLLKPDASAMDVEKLCKEAMVYDFYAVCINGCFVRTAVAVLKGSSVKVAAVVGFPLGAMAAEAKVYEASLAVKDGAEEIDMVMNVGLFKAGEDAAVSKEIRDMKDTIGSAVLKVILETALLTDDEITRASHLAIAAGADFIKTSTGFGPGGATPNAVKLMVKAAAGKAQVKASGGIRDAETARKYISLGVQRLGTSSGVDIVTLFKPKTDEHTY